MGRKESLFWSNVELDTAWSYSACDALNIAFWLDKIQIELPIKKEIRKKLRSLLCIWISIKCIILLQDWIDQNWSNLRFFYDSFFPWWSISIFVNCVSCIFRCLKINEENAYSHNHFIIVFYPNALFCANRIRTIWDEVQRDDDNPNWESFARYQIELFWFSKQPGARFLDVFAILWYSHWKTG